ncbi:MAG: methyltransferase [Burkholderiales bacterium]
MPVADAYTLKMILDDWDDDACIRILGNLRRRAAPPGRVFIIEHVTPESGMPDYAALFDMHMMCWGTGRERAVRSTAAFSRHPAGRSAPRGTRPAVPSVLWKACWSGDVGLHARRRMSIPPLTISGRPTGPCKRRR